MELNNEGPFSSSIQAFLFPIESLALGPVSVLFIITFGV